MRICILGAGALGSAMGGTLAEAGHDVTLITRNASHVNAINAAGLILRTGDKDRTVRLAAGVTPAGMSAVDLVIVLVKSFDTHAVMAASRNIIGPETVVMSLQNGLGQEDVLSGIVGPHHILAGKTYVGGVMLAPGQVIAGTEGKETIIGELDGRISQRLLAITAAFQKAGLPVVVSSNILGAMWDKLLVNVATGAVAAITRLTYGELYAVPEIEACALAAVAEAMAVARAKGIMLDTHAPRDAWLKAARGLSPEFKTSMLQSLEKGSVTEIDFINGAVVRGGASVGVSTPVNATLVALVKGIEHALPKASALSKAS